MSLPLKEGDRVLVKIWLDTVFADTARIQDHGLVVLPRVGPVSVEGVAGTLVADSVRSAYARVFRALTIEVTPLRRVTMIGEVRRPGVYYLELRTTFRDAMAMAGGITEIGREKRMRLVRDTSRTRIDDWFSLEGEAARVHSGDVVIVEREPWIKRNVFTLITGTSVLISTLITLARL